MSANKFYIWDIKSYKDPFDFKRGEIKNKDIIKLLNNEVEFLYPNKTVVNNRLNNFLILNYLKIHDFKPGEKIGLNEEIKDFCCKNSIRIVVSFTREMIRNARKHKPYDPNHLQKIDNVYYMFNKKYSAKGTDLGISFFDHAYNIGVFPGANIEYNKPIEKTKKFSIITGRLEETTRVSFVLRLIRDNLHNDPEILFTKIAGKSIDSEYIRRRFPKQLKEIYEKNKLYLEEDTFLEDDMTVFDLYRSKVEWRVPDIYYSALINVAFETRPYAWAHGSLTEKTWKPIMAGIPFIWISFPYHMQYLKSLGYRFYSFIDYGFDSIEDDFTRYKAVYHEFKRLNNFSLEQLKEMIDSESHIAEHNKKVFYNRDYRKELMNVFSSITKF